MLLSNQSQAQATKGMLAEMMMEVLPMQASRPWGLALVLALALFALAAPRAQAAGGGGGYCTGPITYDPLNPPVALPDAYAVDEDQTLTVPAAEGALANDYSPQHQTMAAWWLWPAPSGFVMGDDGAITYTPPANFNGVTVVNYVVADLPCGRLSGQTTITITVRPVDDPLVPTGQTSYELPEDGEVGPLLLATDPDGDPVSATIVSGPEGLYIDGPFFKYVPPANFNGTVQAVVALRSGSDASVELPLTFQVTPVNDAPSLADTTVSGSEDSELSFQLVGSDVDNNSDQLVYRMVSPPTHGTLDLTPDGHGVYRPNANYNGLDRLAVEVRDPSGATARATVNLTVTPVNDLPVAVVNCTAGVLQVSCSGAGSSDADGQDLRYSWEFGDGGVAGLVTTSHLYSAGGVYTVKLTVTSDNDTASATQVVEVVAPRLSLTSTSATEPDNHQTVPMLFTVRLDRPSPAATTVRWSTANGTATAGSDYQAASGTVTIPAGQTSANFTVTILGDKKREADESFRVTLTNPSGGAVIGQESTLATIVDDD
jgi:hypothetical protein